MKKQTSVMWIVAGVLAAGTARGDIAVTVVTPNEGFLQDVRQSTYTWTGITFTKGANDILIVAFGGEHSATVTSVTHGGTPMTLATGWDAGLQISYVYYRLNPPSGSNVVVTLNGDGNRLGMAPVYATGVAQTAPEATITDTDGTASLTASQGALVVDHAAEENDGPFLATSGLDNGNNQIYRDSKDNSDAGSSYYVAAAAGSVATDWSANPNAVVAMASFAAIKGGAPGTMVYVK